MGALTGASTPPPLLAAISAIVEEYQVSLGRVVNDTTSAMQTIAQTTQDAAASSQVSAQEAGASATTASNNSATATSAAQAAADSETSCQNYFTQILVMFKSLSAKYLGEFPSDPTQDALGNPIVGGAEYYNTTTKQFMVYDSTQGKFVPQSGDATTASNSALLSATQAAQSASDAEKYAALAKSYCDSTYQYYLQIQTAINGLPPVASSGAAGDLVMINSDATAYQFVTQAQMASILGTTILKDSTLTGSPTAPSPQRDDASDRVATCAWFLNQAASVLPLSSGLGSIGTSYDWARADHQHPTDKTRAPVNGTTDQPFTAKMFRSTAGTPLDTTTATAFGYGFYGVGSNTTGMYADTSGRLSLYSDKGRILHTDDTGSIFDLTASFENGISVIGATTLSGDVVVKNGVLSLSNNGGVNGTVLYNANGPATVVGSYSNGTETSFIIANVATSTDSDHIDVTTIPLWIQSDSITTSLPIISKGAISTPTLIASGGGNYPGSIEIQSAVWAQQPIVLKTIDYDNWYMDGDWAPNAGWVRQNHVRLEPAPNNVVYHIALGYQPDSGTIGVLNEDVYIGHLITDTLLANMLYIPSDTTGRGSNYSKVDNLCIYGLDQAHGDAGYGILYVEVRSGAQAFSLPSWGTLDVNMINYVNDTLYHWGLIPQQTHLDYDYTAKGESGTQTVGVRAPSAISKERLAVASAANTKKLSVSRSIRKVDAVDGERIVFDDVYESPPAISFGVPRTGKLIIPEYEDITTKGFTLRLSTVVGGDHGIYQGPATVDITITGVLA